MRGFIIFLITAFVWATDATGCKPQCYQKSLSETGNDFMFKLFTACVDGGEKCKSLIISAFNVAQVMTEITNAACGKTLDELKKYFKICDLKKVNNDYKNYIDQMQIKQTGPDGTEAYVRLCSAIYIQKGFPVLKSYINLLQYYFNANATNVDFAKQPKQTTAMINKFVSDATLGLINKLFDSSLPTNTVILEVATVYFFSKWPRDYFRFDSTVRAFNRYCDYTVQNAQYINNHNAEGATGYAEMFGLKIASIPYISSDYFFMILLPLSPSQDPSTLMKKMNSSMLNQISDATKNQQECLVNVTIPRFQINYRIDLVGIFEQAGINALFNKADMCHGVNQSQVAGNLVVSDVVHEVIIKLSQNGTLAAAATAAGVTTTAVRFCQNPKQFYANRPFGFIIWNNKLKSALFTGVCYNPNFQSSNY